MGLVSEFSDVFEMSFDIPKGYRPFDLIEERLDRDQDGR